MGGVASRMRRAPGRERRLLLLGLDGAGKSTVLTAVDPAAPAIAPAPTPTPAASAAAGGGGGSGGAAAGRALAPGAAPAPAPTTSFVVKSFDHGGLHFHLWDVGGAERLRPYWRHYYTGTQGIVYVVDAADRERVDIAAAELAALAADDQLVVRGRGRAVAEPLAIRRRTIAQGIPIAVLANKTDVTGALSVEELKVRMQLERELRDHQWQVFATVATAGTGLRDCLDFLARHTRPI